ncbi:MAG: homocysteine biosynthesis protein [Pseudomonadota bacterium]
MTQAARTIDEINRRIGAGTANVCSISQLTEGERENLDIVTVAFSSPVSGTAAMLCVPVAGRGVFTRAEEITLNGVPGVPGPAPNERLGLVDTMIYAESEDEVTHYCGAQLFCDLLRGEKIEVECTAVEGTHFSAVTEIAEMEFARAYAFNAFVDQGLPMSAWKALGRGSRILFNEANGIILGRGTRDGIRDQRSWSLAADMYLMNPDVMESAGKSARHGIGNMIAVAIPVLNASILDDLSEWEVKRAGGEHLIAASQLLNDRIAARQFSLTDTDAQF